MYGQVKSTVMTTQHYQVIPFGLTDTPAMNGGVDLLTLTTKFVYLCLTCDIIQLWLPKRQIDSQYSAQSCQCQAVKLFNSKKNIP